jgi:hypothetical protein
MSLTRFAWRTAGPWDAAINFVLNFAITAGCLWKAESLPLVGWPPAVVIFLGPMVFLLFTLATFSGFANGIKQRMNGWSGEPLARDTPWKRRAIITGLAYGTFALGLFLLGIFAIDAAYPGIRWSAIQLIAVQSLSSAALGYGVQVNAVLQTRRL